MLSALKEIDELPPLYRSPAIQLLQQILTNILIAPFEVKFRRLNAGKLLPRLRSKAALRLLLLLGFAHSAVPMETTRKEAAANEYLIMAAEPTGEELQTLRHVQEKLSSMLAKEEAAPKDETSPSPSPSASPLSFSPASSSSSSSSSFLYTPSPAPLPFGPHAPQEGDVVEDDRFVLFWHAPSWPAQWTPVPFVVDGVCYRQPEQWMMACKARLFGDEASLQRILSSSSPREAKKLGRGVQNFKEDVWQAHAFDIVVQGNLAKFSQHPAFAARLLATGDKVLVEASPLDSIWGAGVSASDPRVRKPKWWPGQNLLGKALEKVRQMLREKQQEEEAQAAK